jgi:hypothetical protein
MPAECVGLIIGGLPKKEKGKKELMDVPSNTTRSPDRHDESKCKNN